MVSVSLFVFQTFDKKIIQTSYIQGDDYDLAKLSKLIMMLETGCPVSAEEKMKMCSFLLSASLDQNAAKYNATALRIFDKVCL